MPLRKTLRMLLVCGGMATGVLHGNPNAVVGSEPLLLGLTPMASSLGGAICTETGYHALVAVNPVAAASLLRHNLSISYLGLSSNYTGLMATYSLPTLYGVLSFNYTGVLSGGLDVGNMHGGSISFAKEVSTRVRFGAGLGVDVPGGSPLVGATAVPGVYLDFAVLYQNPNPIARNFGIGRMRYGVLFKQLGLFPNYTTNSVAATVRPGFDLRTGISFDWLRLSAREAASDLFRSRLMVDVGLVPVPFNFNLMAGLKNTFVIQKGPLDTIDVNAGFFLSFATLGVPNLGPWSAGLNLHFDFKPTELTFAWSLVPEKVNNTAVQGFFQNFSLGMAFGRRDTAKPVIDTGDF